MPAISDPLLEVACSDEKVASDAEECRKGRRLAVCALTMLVAVVGLASIQYGPPDHRSSSKTTLPTELVEGWGDARCYTFTGGTCHIEGCDAVRNATCSGWGKCFCATGCAGADGLCYPTQGEIVASNFKLRNVKYNNQYMYIPSVFFEEQLRTTEFPGKYATSFNLWKVPGSSRLVEDMYYLQPVAYPEYTVGIGITKMWDPFLVSTSGFVIPIPLGSLFPAYAYHMTTRHLLAKYQPFNPVMMMMDVCTPAAQPDAVVLNGAMGKASLYIHHLSWEVFGWVWSDPGEGGYWVPDPPIDHTFRQCA